MNRLHILGILSLSCLLFLASCKKDEAMKKPIDSELTAALNEASNGKGKAFFKLPHPSNLSQIPQDPRNPLTPEKIQLGRMLFHETSLGLNNKNEEGNRTYSCASCHFASAGFQAGRFQGLGEGGIGFGTNGESRFPNPNYFDADIDAQPIRTPSTLNGAYQELMLWNGQFGATDANIGTDHLWTADTPLEINELGFQGLETQAIAGLDVHRLEIDENPLIELPTCRNMFDASFKNTPSDERYTRINGGLAIAAYERTLMANEAPFQQWLNGDLEAMNTSEKEGAILFFGKANCVQCHTGPALNSMDFYGLGMKDLFDVSEQTVGTSADVEANFGRGGFTKNSADNYKFKVPQLYNLKDSPFLGHGASFRSVKEVIDYKNQGIKENERVPNNALSTHFQGLDLNEDEVNAITSFIEDALYDNNLLRYQPEELVSGQCFPNNDVLSIIELGCNP